MPLPTERLDTFSGDAVNDMLVNVALGQIPNAKQIYVVGHNEQITAGTSEVLWPLGGAINQIGAFPLNPVTCYLSSSSASDTAVIMRVACIDSNWDMVDFGVNLNGQTAVALPSQVRRVLRIENANSHATVGDIYAGTESAPVSGIPAVINTLNMYEQSDQTTHSGIFTIPRGYVGLIYEFGGGSPANDALLISGYYSNPETIIYKNGMHLPVYRNHVSQRIGMFRIPEKTDIYLSAKSYTQNAIAIGILIGVLLPSDYATS